MSDDNNNTTTGGGRSLGGGAAEPLPSSWSQPSERPRVGRIGDWSGSSSRYSVLSWIFQNAVDVEKMVTGVVQLGLAALQVWVVR